MLQESSESVVTFEFRHTSPCLVNELLASLRQSRSSGRSGIVSRWSTCLERTSGWHSL